MKLSTITIVTILSNFFFVSCNNTNKESINEPTEIITEESHHRDEQEAIELNNGEKWKVVPEMLTYIRNIEQAVSSFEGGQIEDYTVLAKTIDSNLIDLTSSCTMDGQAHDELHKWLVPFIELSEQFDIATTLTEQEKIYADFKAAFVEFNNYFE